MARTEVFERLPDRYEAWFTRHPAAYASELAAIRALWPPVKEALEVGVGPAVLPGRWAFAMV